MKYVDNKWQTFFIYGSEDHRHLIIRLVVKPFIYKYFTEAKLIADFYLEFDVDNKEKLIFAILIKNGYSPEFQNHFSLTIKKPYLKRLTKNAEFNLVHSECLFPEFEIPAELVQCGVFNKISSVMLETLGSSSINEGQLLYISLFLQLCWISQNGLKNLNNIDLIILRGYRIRNLNEQYISYVNSFYISNEEILHEIYDQLFIKNSKSHKPKWIIDWLKQCYDLAERNTKQFKDRSYIIELASYYIPAILNKQLGVSGKLNYIQMGVINKLFTDRLGSSSMHEPDS